MNGFDVDRWMRRLLALPGIAVDILDRLQPVRLNDQPLPPAELQRRISGSARYPEAYLGLEPGLHHVDVGEGLQAYQVRGATAFCVGGLNVADAARVPALSRLHGGLKRLGIRRVLMFPLRAGELAAVRATGFCSVQVGVEAWLDLPGLTFRGNRFEGARHMRNRSRRHGTTVQEIDVERHRVEIGAIYEDWLQSKRPRWRMKLLVGSPGLERPFDRRYFAAARGGRIEAFVTVLPGREGVWGVDVMCRRPDAFSGAMEHLLMHIAEVLRDEGADLLSLGPCPMAEIGEDGAPRMLRAIFRMLYQSWLGNRVFGFRSLHRFKKKFRPRWEPVFFAARPRLGVLELYLGCRMWGLY